MQGWLFYHDSVFWTEPRIRTFLTSIPLVLIIYINLKILLKLDFLKFSEFIEYSFFFIQGRMIVLDLQSEQFPQYKRLNSYYGQPFIWCMLHNFGGTLGMFGSAEIINHVSFPNSLNNTVFFFRKSIQFGLYFHLHMINFELKKKSFILNYSVFQSPIISKIYESI